MFLLVYKLDLGCILVTIMNVLEKIIGVIAVPTCVNCEYEGFMLCQDCKDLIELLPRICYRCGALDKRGICPKCKPLTRLNGVFLACIYKGSAQKLVRELKYKHSRITANPIAEIMLERLPKLEQNWVVVAVPSATKRIRERSFDHSELIAQKYAKLAGHKFISPLSRIGQSRQVGAKRIDRMNQLCHAFWVNSPALVKGKNIIVIDDVITTGASVSAIASTLKKSGAKKVVAMSFAHKKLN